MKYLKQPHSTADDNSNTVFAAIELSEKSWLQAVHTPLADKISLHKFAAHDSAGVIGRLHAIRQKVQDQLDGPVRIMSIYEAGRDGFWLHRLMCESDINNRIIDPSSVQVNRRARRAKTDKLDAKAMVRSLMAFARGEEQVFSVIDIPTVEQEDAKRLLRERKRLITERVSHTNRIKSLLALQGIYDYQPLSRDRYQQLDTLQLTPLLKQEIIRELKRMDLTVSQIREIERERNAVLKKKAPSNENEDKIQKLYRLKGIGEETSTGLVQELYYRKFKNRRKLAGFTGLSPSPYSSGNSEKDQGISKSGPQRVRAMAIELAWLWLRHQPDSVLSQWFFERVGKQKGRMKRIAIVALARKLLIALWRYLETGQLPEGANMKS